MNPYIPSPWNLRDLQRLEIQLSEKKIKEAQHNLEGKKETLKAAEDRLKKKQTQLKEKKVELEQIIEKTEKEEDKLIKKSTKAKKNIEDRLLKSYEKLRNAYRNGLAVEQAAVALGGLDAVSQGVPEVEDHPQPRLPLVRLHHRRLDAHAPGHGPRQ